MKISKSILVVDDHPIVLAGLRTLISQDGLYTKIQCASDLPSAREIINQENIDTAIIDLELSNDNGLALIKLLHQEHPKTKIVVYTMHQEIWTIRQLMNEDADAIVLKNENPQELLTALHKIEDGKGITANSLSGSSTCRILDKSTYPVESWKSWNIFLMDIPPMPLPKS